jgi:hypothetical protein
MHFYIAAGVIALGPKSRKVLMIYDWINGADKLPRRRKGWPEKLEDTTVHEEFNGN